LTFSFAKGAKGEDEQASEPNRFISRNNQYRTNLLQIQQEHASPRSRQELEHLAMPWVQASEDPDAGIDQTSDAFRSTLLKAFHALDPIGKAGVAGAYALREKQPSRNHFSQMSADCSKFPTAHRQVRASKPTGGCSEENII
jgi:hypothetical protein